MNVYVESSFAIELAGYRCELLRDFGAGYGFIVGGGS